MYRLAESLALGALILSIGALIITYQMEKQYERDHKAQTEFNGLLLDYAHGRAIPKNTELLIRVSK